MIKIGWDLPKGKLFLPEHTKQELKQLYKTEDKAKPKIRLLAAIYRKKGKTLQEISEAVGYPLTTVRDWLTRFHKEGLHRRYNTKQPGRKKRLISKQLKELDKLLERPPLEQGLPFAIWTTKLVQYFINKKYNVLYKPVQVWRIVKKLNYSLQKPRPKHYKANKKAQEDFKKTSAKKLSLILKMDGRSYFWTKPSSS